MRYRITFILLSLLAGSSRAQNNDSLMRLLSTGIPDTAKLQIMTDLSWNYLGDDLEKAGGIAREELALATRIHNKKYIAQAYNDLGIVLIRQSRFREALAYHQKALEIRLTLGTENDIASSYSKLGLCYTELSDFAHALEADLKALAVYERSGNKLYECTMLCNICNIYSQLKNFASLVAYAKRAYALSLEIEDAVNTGRALNYLAEGYEGQQNIDKAISTQEQALKLFTELADSSAMAAALNNIGYYYRQTSGKKRDKALDYYLKALAIAQRTGDLNSEAIFSKNAGNVYMDMNRFDLSEHYLKRAAELAAAQSMPGELIPVNKSLGDLYALTNRGAEAVAYYNRYSRLQDSVFSGQLAKQLSGLQVTYETEKKETENRLLQNENRLKTAELGKSRLIQIFLACGIAMSALLGFLLYNRSRLKQRQRLDEELLLQKKLRSDAVIAAEENERTRIARELHDGIGQQLSAARLNISGLQAIADSQDEEEQLLIRNALDLLDDSVKEVRSVSHSMMANSLLKSGLASAVREFIHKISITGKLKVNLEIIDLAGKLEPTIELILFRILQETVNNILKHAQADEINMQLIRHDSELSILVEDNGVGFDYKSIQSSSAGIGLKNIESRVAFLNGQVFFDSYPGKGTTVNITIPL